MFDVKFKRACSPIFTGDARGGMDTAVWAVTCRTFLMEFTLPARVNLPLSRHRASDRAWWVADGEVSQAWFRTPTGPRQNSVRWP